MSLLQDRDYTDSEQEVLLPERRESVFDQKVLRDHETAVIDVSGIRQIYDENDPFPLEVFRLTGEKLPFIAQIGLPRHDNSPIGRDDQFFLLDTRHSNRYDSPYVLLKEENDRPVVKGLWAHKTAIIGRAPEHGNRFHHSEFVSGTHFSLKLQGDEITLQNLGSKNGVHVMGFIVPAEDDHVDLLRKHGVKDDFTQQLVDRARSLIAYDNNRTPETPYGTMKGFTIIGRESPTVRNGVYGTLTPKSEFVIVNSTSPQIRALEDALVKDLRHIGNSASNPRVILNAVRSITAHAMRYDLKVVEEMSAPYYESSGLIALSDYIDKGVGVCRQQALLAAVLVEKAISVGALEGTVHVERNRSIEARGAHAWAVFSGSNGGDVIVDPAQHFVGTRDEAAQNGMWPYYVDASPRP